MSSAYSIILRNCLLTSLPSMCFDSSSTLVSMLVVSGIVMVAMSKSMIALKIYSKLMFASMDLTRPSMTITST